MVEDKWLLLASFPVVVFLGVSIRRRMRDLNQRIEQLKREEAAGPIDSYRDLYEMMDGPDDKPRKPSSLLLKAMGKSNPPNGSLRLSPPERSERDRPGVQGGEASQFDVSRQQEDNDG